MQNKKLFIALGASALALIGTVGISAHVINMDAVPTFGTLEKVEDNEYVYASFGYNKAAENNFAEKTLLKTSEGKNNGFSWSVDGNADHKWAVSYQNAENNGGSNAYYSWNKRYLFGANMDEGKNIEETVNGVNGNLLTMSTSDPIWGGVASYAQTHNNYEGKSVTEVGLMMQYNVASLQDVNVYMVKPDNSFYGYVLYSVDDGATWANATENDIWSGLTTATGITLGNNNLGFNGDVVAAGNSSGLVLTAGAKAAKNVRLCFVSRNIQKTVAESMHLVAITVNQGKALDAYLYNDTFVNDSEAKTITLGTAHKYNSGSDTGFMTYNQETSLLSYGITPSDGAKAKMEYISTYCVKPA